MRGALLLLALLASPAGAGEAWPALAGSGLLTLPDAATLPRGHAVAALSVDNRDRDPLGLDLLDGSLGWTVGVGHATEAYGRVVLSRVASLPEAPALPPPPLDLIVAPGAASPARPYHALFPETPYVNKRGSARFDAWVPGDASFGVKRRFSDAGPSRPALAGCLEVKLPLTRELSQLQSGSGTGAWDVGGRLVADWDWGAGAALATAAYVRTGDAPLGDRLLAASLDGIRVDERRLELADRLELGLGARRRLSSRWALVAEAVRVFEVGARTPVVDASPPLDLLAGAQLRWGRARFAVGLRYHANAPASGRSRESPLAAFVDLTDVAEGELADYLQAVGAAGALPYLRTGAQRVISTSSAQELPEGAHRLPASYRIRSEHQVGFVLAWGWAF